LKKSKIERHRKSRESWFLGNSAGHRQSRVLISRNATHTQTGRTGLESLLNGSLIFCVGRGNVSRTATIGAPMQTIEITDPLELRRCRYAQYRGEKVRMIVNGVPVTGTIRSIKEDQSSSPTRWTVTVVPKKGIAA
jgi:hypothetical protein